MKFESSLKLKLIYVFRINDEEHKGCLKIGEATSDNFEIVGLEPNSKLLNDSAKKRINQYTQTAGIKYDLLYTEITIYSIKGIVHSFSDAEVHKVLVRSGIQKKTFNTKEKANEWFITDLATVKNAIKAVKEGRESLNNNEKSEGLSPVIFRPEQQEAIDKTKKQFKKGNEMLWFAKMRFGKTLSALQVVKDLDFSRTLILTHRPVVDAGWFEDFGKVFYDKPNFTYGSKTKGDSFQVLEKKSSKTTSKYIYFASMQDLRGSELVGGNFDKNNELFKTSWDFIIVDEAHEGTQTELGKNVITELKKTNTKVLHLSGTPFNLLDNYKEEEIYTWDYVMEQRAKTEWDTIHLGDPNPYISLPRLNIFTYDIGNLLKSFVDEEVAFNFREFFRVNEQGKFLHEKDVLSFLNLICKEDNESNYPYSTQEYRDNFRHSLWMVPGVKEAKALSTLLQSHAVFGQFEIVNVAGEGDNDDDKANDEALSKVQRAISNKPNETYSITLSCGRLTTGVSVPAWTAVFMLSGSYNTSASTYMQTIFRVQTPATINGRIKEECFVFDFAPDRTLKVIAETAKISSKAGKTTSTDRQIMGEFLNFCPIISVHGSRMITYNVEGMLEQLKKMYVERVVRNGFEDSYLYNNDQLMQLSELELNDFNELKGIIGSTKAMSKTGDIDINKQGFSDEEYEQLEGAKKKNKTNKELSDEEKELLKQREELKKNRDSAVSILRGISIRMPLLIYGAEVKDEEKQLDIDNFTELIDDKSWAEFMPAGVTKEVFKNFKKYYESDVFRSAGKRIRAMARVADNLNIEERIARITTIFSTFRNPDKETILTPWRVVNMHMSDCLGGYTFFDEDFEKTLEHPRFVNHESVTNIIFASDSKILEINSKSGMYPLYMAYSIYRTKLAEQFKDPKQTQTTQQQLKIWDTVIAENIFVICKTPMAKSITKRTLAGFRDAKVNTRHFEDLVNQIIKKPQNFITKTKQGKTYWITNNNDNMKFNAIVSNPPYQEMDGGAQASAGPIYNHFVEIAKKICPTTISMIMPSRWYSGGKGLDDFRNNMLNDKHIAVLHDFLNPEQVFPNTNIRGGICYFLWNKEYDNEVSLTKVVTHQLNVKPISVYRSLKTEGSDILIRHGVGVSIIEKVSNSKDFESISNYVSSAKAFGFRTYFINDERFKENITELLKPIMCYGRGGAVGYVEEAEIETNKKWIHVWKVYVPESNNIGTELNDNNQNSIVGNPATICTETYLVIGAELLLDKTSSTNLSNYLRTTFARFMHSLAKISQHGTSKTYKFVPLQNFTKKSDIDWSKSISEIDQQLYSKYNLTPDEVAFIESMIKPMA